MVVGRRGDSSTRLAAGRLHDWAVAQARAPALYGELGAPDTVEGRFELLTLHIVLLIRRLGSLGAPAEGLRQALFDTYLSQLDGALREMGVGDLAMGKRMRGLGGVFYGRARAYDAALGAGADAGPLEALITRTLLDGISRPAPGPLANHILRQAGDLAACHDAPLLAGRVEARAA